MSAQNPQPVGFVGAFLGLIGFSALAGVLVTAMVAPVIAVASVSTNSTVAVFDELPDYLEFGQLSQRNTLWATQGGQPVQFATVYSENRQEVLWEGVSDTAKNAAVAAEDRRFYTHGGVDVAGIARAAVNNFADSGSTQGASTITQQLVKNLLINEALKIDDEADRTAAVAAAQETSLERKLKEAKLAIGVEKDHTKQEILLKYLNIAGFGGNTYGIQAAAQLYFSVNATDLSVAQSASLLAIVQNPNNLRIDIPENRPANLERRNAIINNMLEEGMIDQPTHDEAIATPLDDTTIRISPPNQGCQYATAAKQFCDYVLRNIANLTSLGSTPEERMENWRVGGYRLNTTIDLDQQATAEATLAQYTPATETRFQLGSALSTIQTGTGQIRVMAQNKRYDNTEAALSDPTATSLNFNTDQAYGGSTGFQVGSTYKLFTLVNWLQNGHGLNETVNGSPATYVIKGDCATNRAYPFKNDGNSNPGRITVNQATSGSVNAAFANMASKLDICSIIDTAKSMGVHPAKTGAELGTYATSILGVDSLAPMTIANAYATVASGGVLCQPIAVDSIIAADGTQLPGQSADCAQAIAPEIAAAAASALQGVMRNGTGRAANPFDGTPLIGKTGTAEATSTMLAAASTKLASAVWVGNIVGTQSLRAISVGRINGGQLRFSVMKPMLASLDASVYNAGAGNFPTVTNALQNGQSQPVPDVTGQSVDRARSVVQSLGLVFAEGDTVASDRPAGTVVSTDPGAGSRVSRGTTVRAQISDGSLATVMPNVVGQPVKDAAAAIAAAGFDPARVTLQFTAGDNASRCRVLSTDPGNGATIARSSAVTVVVGGGANPEKPGC